MSLLFCKVFAPDWWLDISQLEKRAELDWGERKMGGRSLDTLGSNSPLSWEGFSISNLDHSCRWRRWGGAPGWPTDPPAPGSLSMSLQTPSGLRWVDPSAILLTIIKKKIWEFDQSTVQCAMTLVKGESWEEVWIAAALLWHSIVKNIKRLFEINTLHWRFIDHRSILKNAIPISQKQVKTNIYHS